MQQLGCLALLGLILVPGVRTLIELGYWYVVGGVAIGLFAALQIASEPTDPRSPAQRRAMREDCRSKGL